MPIKGSTDRILIGGARNRSFPHRTASWLVNHIGGKVLSSLLSTNGMLCSEDFQQQRRFFEINVSFPSRLSHGYAIKQGVRAIECCDEALLQQADVAASFEIEDLSGLHDRPQMRSSLSRWSYTQVISSWSFQ